MFGFLEINKNVKTINNQQKKPKNMFGLLEVKKNVKTINNQQKTQKI